MISTASMGSALAFAQRAIWFRLLPMRAIWRVRSRWASAAAAVQVRVCAIAWRSRSDSPAPAASALARHRAASAGDTRRWSCAVRRSAICAPQGGSGGKPPPAGPAGTRDAGGSRGGAASPSPASLCTQGVCWSAGSSRKCSTSSPVVPGAVRIDPRPAKDDAAAHQPCSMRIRRCCDLPETGQDRSVSKQRNYLQIRELCPYLSLSVPGCTGLAQCGRARLQQAHSVRTGRMRSGHAGSFFRRDSSSRAAAPRGTGDRRVPRGPRRVAPSRWSGAPGQALVGR